MTLTGSTRARLNIMWTGILHIELTSAEKLLTVKPTKTLIKSEKLRIDILLSPPPLLKLLLLHLSSFLFSHGTCTAYNDDCE